jgi:hypothetical protein
VSTTALTEAFEICMKTPPPPPQTTKTTTTTTTTTTEEGIYIQI